MLYVELSSAFKYDVLLIKKAFQSEVESDQEDATSPKLSKNKGEWDWSDTEEEKPKDVKQEFLDTKKMLASMSRSQNILAVAQHRLFLIIQNGKEYNLIDTACDPDNEK
jgi:hypothetical protein